jgi:Hypervirulence associated proteins TUDOR domain
MSDAPKVGDHVQWNTSQGKTRGTVKRRLTSPTRIKGHEVKASEDNPSTS